MGKPDRAGIVKPFSAPRRYHSMLSGDDAALIMTDGGLASLLACFVEGVCRPVGSVGPDLGDAASGRGKRPVVWFATTSDQSAQRESRLAAARHAAALSRISTVIEGQVATDGPSGHAGSVGRKPLGPEWSRLLMAAGAAAIQHGLSRIVWPVQLGGAGIDDHAGQEPGAAWLDAIADASDRALVCGRLLSLDVPGTGGDGETSGITIQTPFVDFTDAQIADLAADVDLPVEAAFLGSTERERDRWRAALAKAGIPMPVADGAGLSPTVRASVAAGARR